jgi:hypothetical protein
MARMVRDLGISASARALGTAPQALVRLRCRAVEFGQTHAATSGLVAVFLAAQQLVREAGSDRGSTRSRMKFGLENVFLH